MSLQQWPEGHTKTMPTIPGLKVIQKVLSLEPANLSLSAGLSAQTTF